MLGRLRLMVSELLALLSSAPEREKFRMIRTHACKRPRCRVEELFLVIEAFDRGIQSIIIGEKTPEQVASDVQKIKDRELAKKRAK